MRYREWDKKYGKILCAIALTGYACLFLIPKFGNWWSSNTGSEDTFGAVTTESASSTTMAKLEEPEPEPEPEAKTTTESNWSGHVTDREIDKIIAILRASLNSYNGELATYQKYKDGTDDQSVIMANTAKKMAEQWARKYNAYYADNIDKLGYRKPDDLPPYLPEKIV